MFTQTINIELHHYQQVEEEGFEYKTWGYMCDHGWYKIQSPPFTQSEFKEATEWFMISNEEDKHFLKMELQYTKEYIEKELKEIEIAQRDNKKLLKNL